MVPDASRAVRQTPRRAPPRAKEGRGRRAKSYSGWQAIWSVEASRPCFSICSWKASFKMARERLSSTPRALPTLLAAPIMRANCASSGVRFDTSTSPRPSTPIFSHNILSASAFSAREAGASSGLAVEALADRFGIERSFGNGVVPASKAVPVCLGCSAGPNMTPSAPIVNQTPTTIASLPHHFRARHFFNIALSQTHPVPLRVPK